MWLFSCPNVPFIQFFGAVQKQSSLLLFIPPHLRQSFVLFLGRHSLALRGACCSLPLSLLHFGGEGDGGGRRGVVGGRGAALAGDGRPAFQTRDLGTLIRPLLWTNQTLRISYRRDPSTSSTGDTSGLDLLQGSFREDT